MILCWNEGQSSQIHDHADSHCFMKMLKGGLTEVKYSWPQPKSDTLISSLEPNIESSQNEDDEYEQQLQEISRATMNSNDVCYINGNLKFITTSYRLLWVCYCKLLQTTLDCIGSKIQAMLKQLFHFIFIVHHLTRAPFSIKQEERQRPRWDKTKVIWSSRAALMSFKNKLTNVDKAIHDFSRGFLMFLFAQSSDYRAVC